MPEIELSAGVLEFDDTGGSGPVIVLLTGLFIGRSLWRAVVADLAPGHRCLVLELPLGAHREPMRDGADLSGRGLAGLVAEFLERFDLHDVTLVGCDWGGAQLVAAYGPHERVGRLVLLPQESFENYPPGLPGKTAWLASKVPGLLALALQQMRIRPIRRSPLNFGLMSKRPVPDAVMDEWLRPALGSARIRRPDHGPRLARQFPDGRLAEVPDSYTLIPEDQPRRCAELIRTFIAENAR
ncbi:alpha/beta fold hydrolase [Actinoplanes aureus]|uniref:Alpha/beta hydrolase n=1 Tax=Actinoplanes aureus TaxID=2792083 RepID=A0A931FZQ8_9ACTN|nr:alpha/beta hydrolase [Actinoplanes aureus]MBG0565035.1 alpha/beta hydrolase [Actinoplanes aureus]